MKIYSENGRIIIEGEDYEKINSLKLGKSLKGCKIIIRGFTIGSLLYDKELNVDIE